jgi:sugar lactone lactonase YvrE
MTRASEPECIWGLGAELGEGPLWSAEANALWFVDIKQKKIFRFHPETGEHASFEAPAAPGFVALMAGNRLLAGLKTGLHEFDPAGGRFRLRHAVEPHKPGNRLNDGAVDREGRLWFGSMDDAERDASGCLYRLDADGPSLVDGGYVITNGPTFSPDGRVLYHTDTLARIIYAFDVSPEAALSNKRVFVRIEDGAGYPDGPVADAEGCVWTGLFGGWSVRRYAPSGELLESVRFPCANVTKIAFGGHDLKTVYATTAWKGLSPQERKAQALAGGLFSFRSAVPGLSSLELRHG